MDSEMGRFLTADPLGYVDGPSQYGFAGNSPANRSDPLGLYQQDFHFYVVYFAAYRVLSDRGRASAIAWASQYVDDYGPTNPLPKDPRIVRGLFPSIQEDVLRPFHFLARGSSAVAPGRENPVANYLLGKLVGSPDDTQLGVFLHSYADSFSHSGFSGLRSRENDRGFGDLRPEIGHAEAGEAPDEPFMRPGLAATAAIEVERAIREYEFQLGHLSSAAIPDEAELRRFYIGVFSRFVDGEGMQSRPERWFQLLQSKSVPVPHYDKGRLDGAFSQDAFGDFLVSIGIQRSWVKEAQEQP